MNEGYANWDYNRAHWSVVNVRERVQLWRIYGVWGDQVNFAR